MKVLITGAAGFIGSNLARRLSASSEVVGLDDLSTGRRENLTGIDIDLVVGSLLDDDALGRAIEGCDAIVHLGARPSVPRSINEPLATHEANATGTLRVLDAARRLQDPLVVVASSSSVYGANPDLPKRESATPMPMSPYAVSKLATEQYALAWQHSYGMRTLAFRFFNVFGPGQPPDHAYAAVVPAFLAAALRGEELVIHGDGEQSRDFTFVGTVCDVIADALVRGVVSDQPVNLAFGSRTTLLEMIALLEGILSTPIRCRHVQNRVGDVRHSQADNARLRSLFPAIEPVALEGGLGQTVAWMRAYLDAPPEG